MSQRTSIVAEARHYGAVIVVFAITGTIAVALSKLVLTDLLGLEGNLWAGPWSYRIPYLLLIPPAYSVTLVAVGTLFGKGHYFARRIRRVWGWIPAVLRWTTSGPRPGRAEQPRDR